MIHVDEDHIDKVTERIYLLLKGRASAPIRLPDDHPDNEFKQLVGYINQFLKVYADASKLSQELSGGELDIEIPKGTLSFLQSLKTLRANLLHLTWTAQEISKGRFGLKVDFMGDFSKAFNRMAGQLETLFLEREEMNLSLQQQVEEMARTRALMLNMMGELKAAKQAAEQANSAKSRFLSMMSHEIRTPMNAVLGYVDLVLEMENIPQEARTYLEITRRSAEDLRTLLDDILDIRKLEAGKMVIEKQPIHLSQLLEEAVEMFSIVARQKGLYLTFDGVPASIPDWILGDENRLRQVLINLLSNAVKFTETGGIRILVQEEERDNLKICVQDTGVGIPPEHLDMIFDAFTQSDQTITRRFGGSGLGTTISKQLVAAMGGRIWADSTPGKGSVFSFTLPISAASRPEKRGCKKQGLPAGKRDVRFNLTEPFRILLAEDREENALLVSLRLRRAGLEVDVAVNGKEAVEAFKARPYHLVLMDIHMSVMDGIEATRQIREFTGPADRHIPIVALTASAMPDERESYLAAGMDHVITKPIRFSQLFAYIEKMVPNAVSQTVEMSAPRGGEPVLYDIEGVDYDRGIRLWKDPRVYLRSLKRFVTENRKVPEQIMDLVRAEKLETALELAHMVKGTAGNLCLVEVEAMAAKINSCLAHTRIEETLVLVPEFERRFNTAAAAIQAIPLPEGSRGQKRVLDKGAVRRLIKDLAGQFKIGMIDTEQVEILVAAIRSHVPDPLIDALEQSVDDFEFDDMAAALAAIADCLDF